MSKIFLMEVQRSERDLDEYIFFISHNNCIFSLCIIEYPYFRMKAPLSVERHSILNLIGD